MAAAAAAVAQSAAFVCFLLTVHSAWWREAAFVRVVVRSNSEPKWCKEVIEGENSHNLKGI